MRTNVQYVVDNSGNKTSVLIPFNQWENYTKKYQRLKGKLDVFKAISEGISEVKEERKKRKELQNLSDFLNEC
jgi:cell shape-determining protein MreC